jgi:hypothetical protein
MGESRGNDRISLRYRWSRLILLIMLAPLFLFAQEDELPAPPARIKKKEKEKEELIEIKGNLYKVHANYLNFGPGISYLIKQDIRAVCIGAGYNFRFKKKYYKVGFQRTDNISFFGTSPIYFTDFHLATGKRIPSKRFNLSYFYGGSFYSFNDNTLKEDPVKRGIGLYGEASAFVKPLYDIGIGLTGFTNLNLHAPVFGVRVELYFSGAYRGKKN